MVVTKQKEGKRLQIKIENPQSMDDKMVNNRNLTQNQKSAED